MTLRDRLTDVLEHLDSTVHLGSPRAVSFRVCHAEIPDAVEAVLAVLAERDAEVVEATLDYLEANLLDDWLIRPTPDEILGRER